MLPGSVIAAVASQDQRTAIRHLSGAAYAQPFPYLFYLDLGGFQLIGSSPEMLVKVEDGIAIAVPRRHQTEGTSIKEDESLSSELLKDPKEKAEHAMLVDLARTI